MKHNDDIAAHSAAIRARNANTQRWRRAEPPHIDWPEAIARMRDFLDNLHNNDEHG